MATVVVKRQPRRPGPELPDGEVTVEAPPTLPTGGGMSWLPVLTTVPMLAGSVAMALMFTNGRGGTLAYVTGGLFGVSMLGMVGASFLGQSGRPSKRESLNLRREYLRQLGQLRRNARRTIREQRKAMFYRHPDPDTLWWIAYSPRIWERRPADSDFGVVRMGLGPLRLATPLRPQPTPPLEDLEPLSAAALRRFVTKYAIVPDLPVAVDLRGFARVYLRGDADACRALVRALLAQAAAFHAPDDLLVAACYPEARGAHWDWLKWLPNALHREKTDRLGHVRLIGRALHGLESTLDDVLGSRPRFNPSGASPSAPHLLVVLDGGDEVGSDHLMTEGGVDGTTLLDIGGRVPRVLDESVLVLDVDERGRLSTTTLDGTKEIGRADQLTVAQAEALARQLAPLRLSAGSAADEPLNAVTGLTDLLDLAGPYQFDPAMAWRPRPNRDRLRVPVGVSPDGAPVELDIKESAQDGMGPHGLLVGATGSGKSELLRTLVLALACTHSSELLNFVLIDFKGGATFTKLDRLPHTSAVITNLADEISLVDRMEAAINGELIRRQELLRKAGNYASQRDYERARAAGVALDPLPSLLIICDEFSELLTAKPEFIEMFVQIGRLGRSLGVHLLLASQRLEEGRLRGLETHLSYRIGLRTFSPTESRIVLGVPDAYELPRSPGHGYMKFGTEPMTRFKAAYVSGAYRGAIPVEAATSGRLAIPVMEYVPQFVAPPSGEEPVAPVAEAASDDVLGDSLLDILVGRIEGQGPPAHQVWLPPLDEPATLDACLGPFVTEPSRGLTTGRPNLAGTLQVPVGIVDKPFEQLRDLLWLNLSGAAGHVAVIGAPQSGKSTLLRTMVCALAVTHTPQEAQFYCLDFGGGSLLSLRGLPHVGAAWSRLDVDQVRRTVAEVRHLVEVREQEFGEKGIDSMATYRAHKREGRFADDPFGDVFLVVDGWGTLRAEYEELEAAITEIATRGLSYGVHVVASATRWMDLRPSIRDLLGTRLELRLGDPVDSMHGRRVAANVPADRPGHGLTPNALHMLTALPRIDGRATTTDLGQGVEEFVAAIRGAWQGPGAPAVRLLPDKVPYESLPAPTPDDVRRWRLPIGIAENDLRPVYADFGAEPHFIVFGDIECGKSTFLRSLARAITTRYTPEQACVIVVDYRRGLLGAVSPEHLVGFASTADTTDDVVRQIGVAMHERLPGPDTTPEQLRARNWWSGPELFLLVDDYDLVAGGPVNPLLPLLQYAAQARDIGLHIVLTRRSGGAGRSMFETFIARLREYGSPGLVMSGDRDEGVLLGNVRPGRLPVGRGWLTSRRDGARLVQLAWLPPEEG